MILCGCDDGSALKPTLMGHRITQARDAITSHIHRDRHGKREKWNARLENKSNVGPNIEKLPNVLEPFDRNFNGHRSLHRENEGEGGKRHTSLWGIDRYWQQVGSTYGCAVRTMYLVRCFCASSFLAILRSFVWEFDKAPTRWWYPEHSIQEFPLS